MNLAQERFIAHMKSKIKQARRRLDLFCASFIASGAGSVFFFLSHRQDLAIACAGAAVLSFIGMDIAAEQRSNLEHRASLARVDDIANRLRIRTLSLSILTMTREQGQAISTGFDELSFAQRMMPDLYADVKNAVYEWREAKDRWAGRKTKDEKRTYEQARERYIEWISAIAEVIEEEQAKRKQSA